MSTPSNPSTRHPLLRDKIGLQTGPINRNYDVIVSVIERQQQGCFWAAQSGQGKTKTIEVIAEMVERAYPGLRVLVISAQLLPSFAKQFLPRELLKQMNLPLSGDTMRLNDRAAEGIVALGKKAKPPEVLLFVDEAQAYLPEHFLLLKQLCNSVSRLGGSLLVVVVGESPKLEELVAKLESDDELAIVERFLFAPMPFHTYTNKTDVQSIFNAMDSVTLEGKSATESFLPAAYSAGFRLENETEAFWEEISALRELKVTVKARFIFNAIRYFLVQAHLHDSSVFARDERWWKEALLVACGQISAFPDDAADDGTEEEE